MSDENDSSTEFSGLCEMCDKPVPADPDENPLCESCAEILRNCLKQPISRILNPENQMTLEPARTGTSHTDDEQ